jgi:predicted O-linked N-acetylglucosamine transferase (SPINDLY family)
LPAAASGRITFGCLNNYCKVNADVLKLWAQVLRRVEGSRIVILSVAGSHRQQALDLLAGEGISPERVTFNGYQPRPRYLKLYHSIDVALDTFPYNGHTTSLDAMWMGVPVVTLVGSTVVGRAGLSQLMNLGLPELVGHTPEQFVEIAVRLANDLPRLAAMRATLRERMVASPLMDSPRFARNLEGIYRQAWQRWCGAQSNCR